MLSNLVILSILTITTKLGYCQFYDKVQFQYEGCFKDNEDRRDLPYEFTDFLTTVNKSIDNCVSACEEKFFIYAGLQNGRQCFCGNSHGRYGPAKCSKRCTNNLNEICGDLLRNSVYVTGVNVPGPPSDLNLEVATEHSLKIKWSKPRYTVDDDYITDYHIHVTVVDSFDPSVNGRTFSPKEIQLSKSSRMTTILGLRPASRYNVSVSAASKNGKGKPTSALFWTEISDPVSPEAPELIHHGHDHDDDFEGEIHVNLKGVRINKYGPISKYRVLVIDETTPSPFMKDTTYRYSKAKEVGLNYWIAAEFEEDYFGRDSKMIEFVVGDNRTYGTYLNYGPLPKGRDFHVSLGIVSSFNKVTKVTYAKVSHDQHAMENIVVFEFHDHSHENDHHSHNHDDDHDHEYQVNIDYATEIGLAVAVALVALIFFALLSVFVYLRFVTPRSSGSRSDAQELTTHISSIETVEAQTNYAFDNDSVDVAYAGSRAQLDNIRSSVWNIPRNFLDLTHEVIGRGQFGSLVKGNVNKKGKLESVNIQVVPAKILEDNEMKILVQDIDIVVKYGEHPNLLQFVGLCEDKETLFVVFEQAWPTLKQALLDSRALNHYPAFAENHGKFATLREEVMTNIMLGIAKGMDHLARLGIPHKKLCAWNIFLAEDQPKIGALGITNYSRPGQEIDLTRWTAQEALRSEKYVWKCDVWSLAIVYWECATLGATPYSDVSNKDLWMHVVRGARLKQPQYVSDEFYQMLLNCWQVDLDERPSFEEVVKFFSDMIHYNHIPLNFNLYSTFSYDSFKPDLEFKE